MTHNIYIELSTLKSEKKYVFSFTFQRVKTKYFNAFNVENKIEMSSSVILHCIYMI